MTDVLLPEGAYSDTLRDVVALLEDGRRAAARSVNALMTATYWLVGRRIVESEQGGKERAAYGQALLQRLSADLTGQFGRGFGADNLELMRLFYQSYPPGEISESVIRKSGSFENEVGNGSQRACELNAEKSSLPAIRNSTVRMVAKRV